MSKRCYIFSHAVTRKVCPSVIEGLRAEDVGAPDFETFQAHHKDYCNALRSTGALVSELEPLNSYPDSVFLEDAALCLQEGVVIMRQNNRGGCITGNDDHGGLMAFDQFIK